MRLPGRWLPEHAKRRAYGKGMPVLERVELRPERLEREGILAVCVRKTWAAYIAFAGDGTEARQQKVQPVRELWWLTAGQSAKTYRPGECVPDTQLP